MSEKTLKCHYKWGYLCVAFFPQENIISPMEDSPIPDISGKDANDAAGTSPRSQGKAFRYLCYTYKKCVRNQKHQHHFSLFADFVHCHTDVIFDVA